MRIYISGPLQAAQDLAAARSLYELFAAACREEGCDVYLPHQNTDPLRNAALPDTTVFDRDLDALEAADVVLAYIGPPSSGVGAELGLAHAAGKPIIGVYQQQERPSRFIMGMLKRSNECIVCFDERGDVSGQVRAALRKVRQAGIAEGAQADG